MRRKKGMKRRKNEDEEEKEEDEEEKEGDKEEDKGRLEARARIELANRGFADLGLTTWLPRPVTWLPRRLRNRAVYETAS
jgi:hypothetical protein